MAARTLVLIGRTGDGKSSIAHALKSLNSNNSIRGESVTKECNDGRKRSVVDTPGTKECKSKQHTLNVVDTPGLFDENAPKEVIGKEIVKCINLAKDGVHGFLFVLSNGKEFTDEEAVAIDKLEMLFGPTIVDYMVIVFTGCDKLEEDYLESCPPNLKRVISRCKSRTAVFNNKSSSETFKENQILELLKQVNSIIADKGNQPYSNELFTKAIAQGMESHEMPDKEKVCEEQIKQLKEMTEKNTRAVEKKNTRAIEDLKEQLKSARSERKASKDLEVKKGLDARIADLKTQLQEEEKKTEVIKAAKKRTLCSFL